MHEVDVTHHAVIRDALEDDVYQREIRKTVGDGRVQIEVSVPGNIVPPVLIETANPEITMHELRQYIAVRNQEARLRRIPEARRRHLDREAADRLLASTICAGCGGGGWVNDHDGTQFPCPTCRPKV